MIDVDLTLEAYALVRDGVAAKSHSGRRVKVRMPDRLAAKLDAARAFGEDMSDVILRLAEEAKAPRGRGPLR